MIDFEDFVINLPVPPELLAEVEPETLSFSDLCKKVNITSEIVEEFAAKECPNDPRYCLPEIPEKCEVTPRPIDFIYNRTTDTFDLSQYEDDNALIAKVQTGKGDDFLYVGKYNNLFVEIMFGGTVPKEPEQDYSSGRNDLYAANAARFFYNLDNLPLSQGYYRRWQIKLQLYI